MQGKESFLTALLEIPLQTQGIIKDFPKKGAGRVNFLWKIGQ